VFRHELEGDDAELRRSELIDDYRERFANPYVAAERGYVDDVIEPRRTRHVLIDALETSLSKREPRPKRKHGNIRLMRFTDPEPKRTLGLAWRASSPRKDDTRLHVDAFPSRPNHGERILRVFANVNPDGKPRVWELGEPFEAVAERFGPRVPPQWPGSAWLLARLGITRGVRTPYDHVMLNLHDLAKLDEAYQRASPKTRFEFPAGSAWMCFTDRVMHAALSGQHAFEQTFYLPVAAMRDERLAPLRILERQFDRALA